MQEFFLIVIANKRDPYIFYIRRNYVKFFFKYVYYTLYVHI